MVTDNHSKSVHMSVWSGTTWQVHLVQLSTTQSSLSSKSRPSCQHMFFSLVFFILPRASFMTVFSSVWTYRQICSQKEDHSEMIRTRSWERYTAFLSACELIHLLTSGVFQEKACVVTFTWFTEEECILLLLKCCDSFEYYLYRKPVKQHVASCHPSGEPISPTYIHL